MKYRLILLLFLVPLFLSNRMKQNKKENTEAADNWSGTVGWSKTSTSNGEKNGMIMAMKILTDGISLLSNRSPGETDDKETSPGNRNNGDGLSAYEE